MMCGCSVCTSQIWYPDCIRRVLNVTPAVYDGISNIPKREHANPCCDQSIDNGMCFYYTSSANDPGLTSSTAFQSVINSETVSSTVSDSLIIRLGLSVFQKCKC